MNETTLSRSTRREFLRNTAATGLIVPLVHAGFGSPRTMADETKNPNDRPRVGCIGLGGMGKGDARAAKKYGDLVAFCDVDRTHAEEARDDPKIGERKGDVLDDYRKLLDRKDIDIVTISTPDHWHVPIALAALAAGKDIYCQKPLTLTIDEGKKLRQAVADSKQVFQVGTQQRSENNNRFLTAIALVREGRLGKIQRVTCAVGSAPRGKAFRTTTPPASLNWDFWLGQAPETDYIKERCHGTFRWWYEYSGGKLTDWGAHHVDIAQWAIGKEELRTDPGRGHLRRAPRPLPRRLSPRR